MAAWLPYAIQGGEALLMGLGAMFYAHSQGGDWTTALSAGVAAMGLKAIPSQVFGGKKG